MSVLYPIGQCRNRLDLRIFVQSASLRLVKNVLSGFSIIGDIESRWGYGFDMAWEEHDELHPPSFLESAQNAPRKEDIFGNKGRSLPE